MKIICIIQARLGSTRLPGKVLLDLTGKTMLERVIERASAIKGIDSVIVATTTDPDDDPVAEECIRLGIESFRGHPSDVLDRYYSAANSHGTEAVMRITADCPLLDPQIANRVVNLFLESKVDYCSNIRPPTYPDGLDVELFTVNALELCWRHADLDSDREHVTTYIRRTQPDRFTILNLENEIDLSGMRWTIDETQDLDFIRALLPELETETRIDTSFNRVIEVLRGLPEIANMNASITRNEGWRNSLATDA